MLSVLCIKKKSDFGCFGFGIVITQTDIALISEFVYVCVGMHAGTDKHILLLNFQSLLLSWSSVKITWFLGNSSGTTDYYLWTKSILGCSSWEGIFFFLGTEKNIYFKVGSRFSFGIHIYFAYTCEFHAVNILSIENLK